MIPTPSMSFFSPRTTTRTIETTKTMKRARLSTAVSFPKIGGWVCLPRDAHAEQCEQRHEEPVPDERASESPPSVRRDAEHEHNRREDQDEKPLVPQR